MSWRIQSIVLALVVLAIGYTLGTMSSLPGSVHADVRKTPPRQAFQSGGERSEVVLREIAGTLKRIDGRLERIEKTVARATEARSTDD
jgi:hypothetical protein